MSMKDIAPYKGKRRKLLDHLMNVENAEQDISEICKAIDLSRTTYYKYVHEPEFQNALKLCVLDNYAKHLPQVASSCIREAKRGNVKAVALIHEVLSMIPRSGPSQVVNVGVSQVQPQAFESDTDMLASLEAEASERVKLIEQVRARITGVKPVQEDNKEW